MLPTTGLLASVTSWLKSESSIKSAVLFGSSARDSNEISSADKWSDIDLHIGSGNTIWLENLNWARALPAEKFCLQVVRPATGGVRKATVLFETGQIDLVLVPIEQLYLARFAMRLGLHKRTGNLQIALNEIHTCIQSGYKFIKGEKSWAPFYLKILNEMPGVRLSNREIGKLAEIFLCEMLWLLQKLDRGELSAAQRTLHQSLAEINFRLVRELRLRQGHSLPSFGLARRAESLLTETELSWIKVDARLDRTELNRGAWVLFIGLKALMGKLAPDWIVPDAMTGLISRYYVSQT